MSGEEGTDHRFGSMHIADFEGGPAAEAAMVVHRRDQCASIAYRLFPRRSAGSP
jgi:hypothetical protein